MEKEAEYERLDEKYHFPSFVGEKDLEKSLNLLDWINKHIKHTGNYDNSDRQDALTLLQVANNKEYHFSKTINYNGMVVDDVDDVKNYYAKNLFFLRCKKVQGYGQHTEYGNMLEIAPKGFDVHKRMIENMLFRIKTYGNFEVFNTWMKYEEGLENKYIDITSIY